MDTIDINEAFIDYNEKISKLEKQIEEQNETIEEQNEKIKYFNEVIEVLSYQVNLAGEIFCHQCSSEFDGQIPNLINELIESGWVDKERWS